MPEWSTACPDWADRLRHGRSIIPPPIFPEEAARALTIFKALRIVDAPGSPTFGECCGQWVFDLVASIFGAYDPDTGRRLITEWLVLIPKKNAKSTIAAGIKMTALVLNWRESAEFTILAPTIEIANNSFGPARDMVRKDDELEALCHVQTHIKTITHREKQATLKVVAADSNTVGGKKSVGTLVDELWLFGKQPDAENMFREAVGGLASRPEGFVVYLTTQSDDPPAGVFKAKLDYARQVRDGQVVDPRFVPVLYEFPDDMLRAKEHLEPANWRIVNPNMGYSVDAEFLEREFRKAQVSGEESVRGFLAKHLNVEVGLTLRSDRWPGADWWEQQATAGLSLEELLKRSEVVVLGIDGGGMKDLLSLSAMGRESGTGNWLHWQRSWAHPQVLSYFKGEAQRFRDFEAAGDLFIVDKLPDDVSGLVEVAVQVFESGLLARIGLDPSRIGVVKKSLEDAGIPEELLIGVSQGWRLMGAIVVAERRLAEATMWHGGQPLMAWAVGNAKVESRGNAILVTKAASGSAKIDPLMATFCAVELMATNPSVAVRPELIIL